MHSVGLKKILKELNIDNFMIYWNCTCFMVVNLTTKIERL